MPPSYDITCLCGLNTQTVELIPPVDGGDDANEIALMLCHCDSCRFSSGQLCTSYYPIRRPADVDVQQRVSRFEDGSTVRYHCRVCGCHVFRETAPQGSSNRPGGETVWEVASGTVKGPRGETDPYSARFAHHASTSDTIDGGAAVWLQDISDGDEPRDQQSVAHGVRPSPSPVQQPSSSSPDDLLEAACACGNVRFSVTRPNPKSYDLHSPYSDMIHPFATSPAETVANPSQEKWWIRGKRKKYMTGACSCRSCRLISGFELQFWSFIPRANIFVHAGDDDQGGAVDDMELVDFSKPSKIRMLQSYRSSPGVKRYFCGTCGAVVFGHWEHRPDLVDVSAGLFRSREGARAESWLQWWTDRVSFNEDTETDRHGAVATAARHLVNSLAEGLKSWKQQG